MSGHYFVGLAGSSEGYMASQVIGLVIDTQLILAILVLIGIAVYKITTQK